MQTWLLVARMQLGGGHRTSKAACLNGVLGQAPKMALYIEAELAETSVREIRPHSACSESLEEMGHFVMRGVLRKGCNVHYFSMSCSLLSRGQFAFV